MISELTNLGPSLQTFSSQLVTTIENFDMFTDRIDSMVSPITILTSAMNDFASSMNLVVSSAAALAESNVGDVTGMAGATTGKGFLKSGKTTLPDTITQLAASIQGMESDSGDNKGLIKKLDEIKQAVIVGSMIEMDGEALTRASAKFGERAGRTNFFNRMFS
jgi:hypothetical protein